MFNYIELINKYSNQIHASYQNNIEQNRKILKDSISTNIESLVKLFNK